MKFTTLIPTSLNDGQPVDPLFLQALVREWAVLFGGCTIEGTCFGHWIDTNDDRHYQDESVRVTVVCDNELYDDAVAAVMEVGRKLDQKRCTSSFAISMESGFYESSREQAGRHSRLEASHDHKS